MYMWMVYDKEGLARNTDYVALYQNTCRKYDIEVEAVLDIDVKNRITGGETPVFVLVRTIHPEINRFLEESGIPVFNSYEVSRICNDKGKTLRCLKEKVLSVPSLSFPSCELPDILSMDIPELRTLFENKFVCSSHVEQEKKVISQAEDFVIKAVDGHGGKQVFSMVAEKEQIRDGIGDRDFVLQPMIPDMGRSRDLRVYVIGKRIVAAVMRSSAVDFRANFSLGGEVCLYKLHEEEKNAVRTIVREFEFGMAGIDFIFDRDDQLFLNEIEDVVGARMLYRCSPDIDLVGQYVDHIVREKLHIV